MKKLLPVSLLLLLVVQLLTLPATVSADDPCRLRATTEPATEVSLGSAVLNGTGALTGPMCAVIRGTLWRVFFQYGTAPGDYQWSTRPMTFDFNGSLRFDQLVEGLNGCAIYYYRAVAALQVPDHGPTGTVFGEEMSFKTLGCRDISHGAWLPELAKGPVKMSNIVVKTAAVSSARVAPGEKVDVTASLTNSGASNGTAKVTLYVNGQEAEVKGVTLTGGESQAIHFTTSQSEPGTYQVFVNGTSAGTFTVDLFTNNDILIYGVIALFTIGIAGVLYAVTRRRATVPVR